MNNHIWDNLLGTADENTSEQARDEHHRILSVHDDWLTEPEVNHRANNSLHNEVRRKLAAEQQEVSINEVNAQDSSQDINYTPIQISDQDEETDKEEHNTTIPTLRRGSVKAVKKKISYAGMVGKVETDKDVVFLGGVELYGKEHSLQHRGIMIKVCIQLMMIH